MYDELVKKLRYCGNAVSCLHCPYWAGCGGSKEALIQAADAIEELKILADNGEATYEIMVRQTSYIEKLKQAIPHWIPVTERLPDFEGCLLCMRKAFVGDKLRYQDILYYDEDGFRMEFENTPIPTESVTHWMPLPEAPKDGE